MNHFCDLYEFWLPLNTQFLEKINQYNLFSKKRKMKNITIILSLLYLPIIGLGQQTIYGSIIHDDLEREYILYVPESYEPGTSAPLVYNFHGYGSTAYQQMIYGDFRKIADTAGFLVVHPMGTKDIFGITHWNVGWGLSTVDDVGFTRALLDSLSLDYSINHKRVFCTGMSNGGFMSYLLACELSNRFAAMASVTGTMNKDQPDECTPQHPMPVMEIHGTADNIVPYYGDYSKESIEDVLAYWTDFNNCDSIPTVTIMPDIDTTDGSTVTHYLYPNGDSGVEVEHFKINNGGHSWPGNVYGGANNDIDASVEIWKFFSRYDIHGKITPTSVDKLSSNTSEIIIYPNPAISFIYIESASKESLDYKLSTLAGQIILSGTINSKHQRLDIKELPQGFYLLKTGNRTFKIIKR